LIEKMKSDKIFFQQSQQLIIENLCLENDDKKGWWSIFHAYEFLIMLEGIDMKIRWFQKQKPHNFYTIFSLIFH
jgi:hypothetical protein